MSVVQFLTFLLAAFCSLPFTLAVMSRCRYESLMRAWLAAHLWPIACVLGWYWAWTQ